MSGSPCNDVCAAWGNRLKEASDSTDSGWGMICIVESKAYGQVYSENGCYDNIGKCPPQSEITGFPFSLR